MTQTNKYLASAAGRGADLQTTLNPRVFKALADPNRIVILERLAGCCDALSVTQVSDCCRVDLSVVSRHLATLREAGIVSAEKRGKRVYYQLKGEELAALLRSMADAVEACCHRAPGDEERFHDRCE